MKPKTDSKNSLLACSLLSLVGVFDSVHYKKNILLSTETGNTDTSCLAFILKILILKQLLSEGGGEQECFNNNKTLFYGQQV